MSTDSGLRLLVVDDAPFIREIVRNVVEKKGIQIVAEGRDGEEAIALALKVRPDVILMDIIMPKKSGIEATKEILRHVPDMKIVAFSTADQDSLVSQALEAGCVACLVKPFSSEELLGAINKAVVI